MEIAIAKIKREGNRKYGGKKESSQTPIRAAKMKSNSIGKTEKKEREQM